MPKELSKSIKIYLSKLKNLPRPQYTNSLLSCKHPKTQSFALDRRAVAEENPNPSSGGATLADLDRFLCENFRSLYPGRTSSYAEPAAAQAETVTKPITTLSTEPFDDFKESMKKMIESRCSGGEKGLDWDFMKELLFCYLDLNDKSVHKYILEAFADLSAGYEFGQKRKSGVKAGRRKSFKI